MSNYKAYVHLFDHRRKCEIYLTDINFSMERGIRFKKIDKGNPLFETYDIDSIEGIEIDPTLTIHPEMLQSIIDAAWKAGMKPTPTPASEQEMTAIKRHLEDERKYTDRLLAIIENNIISMNNKKTLDNKENL